MSDWGKSEFKNLVKLEELVAEFPSKLKQAMYAAANKGIIRRGTWNGCALNAASAQAEMAFAEQNVRSIEVAAKTFKLTNAQVSNFIREWDARTGTDEECTEYLKEILLKAGLFVEPGERLPRIIKRKVFKSSATQTLEAFNELMEANKVPDIDVAGLFLTVPHVDSAEVS